MSDFFKSFLEFLKLAPRYLVALGIVAGILLFIPDKALKFISVFSLTQNYRQWIGLTFVVTMVLFGVDRTIAVLQWMRNRKRVANAIEARLKRLHCLTEDEKQILRFYFAKQTRTNYLRVDDGVVQGLARLQIIFQAASIGSMVNGFAYNITDFAWNYLNENPWLLDGPRIHRTDKEEGPRY